MSRRVIGPGNSCRECRRRKIKCSRSMPCSYCVKTEIECVYPVPSSRSSKNPTAAVDGDVLARLETVERTLRTFELELSHLRHVQPTPPSSSSVRSAAAPAEQMGQDADSLDTLVAQDSATSDLTSADMGKCDDMPLEDSQLSFLLQSETLGSLDLLHPSPETTSFIWQKYLETVDPLLKIFHVPTVQRHVMNVIRGRGNLDSSTECLLFAIYYSAVVSMPAAECLTELEEPKSVLLKQFRAGVESGLSRAGFLNTADCTALQAFTLYLICGRQDDDGPDVGGLIVLAIRRAINMGLHCDAAALGLPPFEVEMRRRLWWHISTLDARTAENNKVDPIIRDSWPNTQLPLNVNDANLDPDMSEAPRSQPGKTEMLFSLVRFEVLHFMRRLIVSDELALSNGYKIQSSAEKREAIDAFKERIETQYLSHCDTKIPFDFVTAASNRLILAKLKLAVSKPQHEQIQCPLARANFQRICVDILQHTRTLRHYEKGSRWLWLFQTYVEWDALTYLLEDLCRHPATSDSDIVRKAVNEIYFHWKNSSDGRRDHRWQQIEELYSWALPQYSSETNSQAEQSDSLNSFTLPSLGPLSIPMAGNDSSLGIHIC